MTEGYNESKERSKKFVYIVMFLVGIFILGYMIFWSRDLYKSTKDSSNDSIRQIKDCTSFSFDSRNIYYKEGKLSFDFYLMGFSEAPINAITIISDKYYDNHNNTYAKDFIFKKDVNPGETKPVSVDIDVNSKFHVMIYNCPVTDTVYSIN